MADRTYVSLTSGVDCSYFIASDGKADATRSYGKLSFQLDAPDGAKFISASGGRAASYLVADSGVVIRIKSKTNTTVMSPPDGVTYVAAEAGEHTSYFLRSDGSVDYLRTGDKVDGTLTPPEGTTYTGLSTGVHSSYLLRSDGVADRIGSVGPNVAVTSQFAPPDNVKYVQVAAGESISFFLRDDGAVDKTRDGKTVLSTIAAPEGTTYTSISQGFYVQPNQYGQYNSDYRYMLRADGVADRFKFNKDAPLDSVEQPDEGVTYTLASNGREVTYILRSDGKVAVTVGGGKIKRVCDAAAPVESKDQCAVM